MATSVGRTAIEAALLEALQWIAANYANQDLSHKDFRVEAAHRAEAALFKTGAA